MECGACGGDLALHYFSELLVHPSHRGANEGDPYVAHCVFCGMAYDVCPDCRRHPMVTNVDGDVVCNYLCKEV